MIEKSPGLVLGQIPYQESSAIVKIYTPQFGTRSFILKGVKKSRKSSRNAFFLPLSLLDLVFYHKPNREIDSISDVRFLYTYKDIPFNPIKSSIGLFLAEFLSKALRHAPAQEEKFNFLKLKLIELDSLDQGIQNFTLEFLFQFCFVLGIGPSKPGDLTEGLGHSLSHLENEALASLFSQEPIPKLNGEIRKHLIETLLRFYHFRMDDFGEIKSLPILHQVLA